MALPPSPAGWSRYLVKAKFGMGRDFRALDPATEELRYLVDGKVAAKPSAEIQDATGSIVYRVKGRLLGIPKKMAITDPDGAVVADLHAKWFSPVKSRMTLTMADGTDWTLEGNFIEKEYTVTSGGTPIIAITQKWVTIRDTYTVDVADGVDPAVALAMLWAVDRFTERT